MNQTSVKRGSDVGPGATAPPEDGPNLLRYLNVLVRRRHTVIGIPFMAAGMTVIYSLIAAPTYTSTATFVPEAGSGAAPSALADLAGRLGVIDGNASQGPQFYAELANSREIMSRALLTRFPDPRANASARDSATLLDIIDVKEANEAARLQRGVRILRGRVLAQVNSRTNVVRLSAQAEYPVLAAAVANRLVGYLNEFNATKRQSRAGERRRFVEERLQDADDELQGAGNDLKTFHERNRTWQQSPNLVFEEGNLRRQVAIRQEVYLTLRRAYETARIDEVNETPVITVIDEAVPPLSPSSPRRLLLLAMALSLGAVVGVLGAFSAEHLGRLRGQDDEDYRELRRLLQQLFGNVRRSLQIWPFRNQR